MAINEQELLDEQARAGALLEEIIVDFYGESKTPMEIAERHGLDLADVVLLVEHAQRTMETSSGRLSRKALRRVLPRQADQIERRIQAFRGAQVAARNYHYDSQFQYTQNDMLGAAAGAGLIGLAIGLLVG